MLHLSHEQRDLIERFGVIHDDLGYAPAPGRIIGLLIVSPQPLLSFDDIRGALNLSKSSTSTALNLLLRINSIRYETKPGERKRYFRKNYDRWEEALLQRFDVFLSLRQLLKEAHQQHEKSSSPCVPEIPRMIGFLEFLEQRLHEAYRDWHALPTIKKGEGP